jgi:hypothetical protein
LHGADGLTAGRPREFHTDICVETAFVKRRPWSLLLMQSEVSSLSASPAVSGAKLYPDAAASANRTRAAHHHISRHPSARKEKPRIGRGSQREETAQLGGRKCYEIEYAA